MLVLLIVLKYTDCPYVLVETDYQRPFDAYWNYRYLLKIPRLKHRLTHRAMAAALTKTGGKSLPHS